MSLAVAWLPIETQIRISNNANSLDKDWGGRYVAFRNSSPRAPGLDSVRFRCIWIFALFRFRGMNAAGREVRTRAGAASRFANVSLLLRTGGCQRHRSSSHALRLTRSIADTQIHPWWVR